jgi:hypothetical protein
MHKLIADYFLKKKLDIKDLTPEEKKTFDSWNSILVEEVTVKKVAEFCERQMHSVEAQWQDMNNSKERNERLIIYHTVYSKIKKMLESDEAERRGLEKHLQELIDTQM